MKCFETAIIKVVRFEFRMILERASLDRVSRSDDEININGRRKERAEPRGKCVVLVAMGRGGHCCAFERDTRRDRGYGIAPEDRKVEPSKGQYFFNFF